MSERVPLVCLFPLRVLVGVMLALSGYHKFLDGWLHGSALLSVLDGWVRDHRTYAFFTPVVETARAHPKILGTLVTMGETVIGGALALGLFTRFAALLGMLMIGSFALAAGERLAPPGTAVLMAAVLFTFVLVPPGRVLGLDQALRGRLPAWLA